MEKRNCLNSITLLINFIIKTCLLRILFSAGPKNPIWTIMGYNTKV